MRYLPLALGLAAAITVAATATGVSAQNSFAAQQGANAGGPHIFDVFANFLGGNRSTAQSQFGPNAQPNTGFNAGFNTQGFNSQGFNNQGFNNQGFNTGFNNPAFNNQGFNNQGFNNQGFNNQGFNNQGFNQRVNTGFNPGFNAAAPGGFANGTQFQSNAGFANPGFAGQGFGRPGVNSPGFASPGFGAGFQGGTFNRGVGQPHAFGPAHGHAPNRRGSLHGLPRMGNSPYGAAGYSSRPALDRNTVANVQRSLSGLGFAPGPIDGVYGPRTARAIGNYQRARGGAPDGRISPQLLQALRFDVQNRGF